MSSLSNSIRPLPNQDLQIRRILKRRVYPCPICGRNVDGCYAQKPVKKSLELADVVIPCPDCGTSTILADIRKGKEIQKVKETGKSYDRFSRVREADARAAALDKGFESSDTDADRYVELADAFAKFARELKTADPASSQLPSAFMRAIASEMGAIDRGRVDLLGDLADLMIECETISQFDLLEARHEAFCRIEEHSDLLPPAVFLKLAVEDCVIANSFEESDPPETEAELKELISRFDSLSPEEKAVCPYVAADALIYIQSLADISGRQVVAVSKKLITAMRKAKKAGAPDDRWRMERLVDAYAVAIPSDSALAEKMLKDAKLWDDPLFGALADFTIVNFIIESYGLESGAISLELMSDEVVSEVVSRCSSALEVMESRDDVRDFSWRMVYLYAVRGIVSRNKDDMKLATDYLRFFLTLGQIDGPLAVNLAILISSTKDNGLSTMENARRVLGL